MNEMLDEFDVKITQMISRFQTQKEEMNRLQSENERLIKEVKAGEEVARQKSELEGELARLREQITAFEGKEDVIRNRLRNILDRVEDIEGEMEELEGYVRR